MEASESICRCCKAKRIHSGKQPRKLYVLPDDILMKPGPNGDPVFANQATPVFICENCDGDVIRTAYNWALKNEPSDT